MQYYPGPEILQLGDLNHNIGTFVQKTAMEHIDPILRVIQALPEAPEGIDIVTWRGVLTRVLATPFDHRTEWCMHGMLAGGRLYIDEQRLEKHPSPREAQGTYWGHKFETLCMIPHDLPRASVPPLAVRREAPVNTNAEFATVATTRLGRHRFILGAEVDGLDESGREYIELKTSKAIEGPADQQIFNQKLMKFWLQSYLIGIERILVGFRDRRARLKSLEYLAVREIPRLVRGKVQWDPNALLLMGDLFFAWLRERVQHYAVEGQELKFRIRHRPNGNGVIEFDLMPDLPSFLPSWFTRYS